MKGVSDASVVRTVVDLINKNNYAILHTHEYKSDIIGRLVARSSGIRLVSTCHGWIRNSMKSRVYAEIQKRALRGFDKVIAVSPAIRAELKASSVPDERIEVLHNAIVTDDYRKSEWQFGEFRDSAKIDREKVLIGYVGRLSIEKGQREFLAAIAPILRKPDDVHVVIVGDGPDSGFLRTLAGKLRIESSLTFAGYLTDVRPVMRDCDLLALTSRTEGFPNVILEAMCMELPVIATDVGGTSILVENMSTGQLIPAQSESAIEGAIRKFLEGTDGAQRMASSALARVVKRFDFSARCRKLEAIYSGLVKDGGGCR